MAVKRKPPKKRAPLRPRDVLNAKQQLFADTYLVNGFNAGAAYREAYPDVTNNTAYVSGSTLLRNPKVQDYLKPKLEKAWGASAMSGEEAIARIGDAARADIRRLYDARGELLPPHDWPDDLASVIDSYEKHEKGDKVRLVPKLSALRTILEVTGKLRGPVQAVDDLTAALQADLEAHRKQREGK